MNEVYQHRERRETDNIFTFVLCPKVKPIFLNVMWEFLNDRVYSSGGVRVCKIAIFSDNRSAKSLEFQWILCCDFRKLFQFVEKFLFDSLWRAIYSA